MRKERFCSRGHDTLAVGRTIRRHCNICSAQKIKEINWRRWGILNTDNTPFTTIDYDRAYQVQQGRCKICKRHQLELSRKFDVDHSHSTFYFRGLLCVRCNTTIGAYEKFHTAIQQYLGESQCL